MLDEEDEELLDKIRNSKKRTTFQSILNKKHFKAEDLEEIMEEEQ